MSSFGIGGTNAHVVLEQAPAAEPSRQRAPAPDVYVVSARSAGSLAAGAARPRRALARRGDVRAQPGPPRPAGPRPAFAHRAAVAASTCAEAAAALSARRGPGAPAAAERGSGGPAVVFAFPGQGAQYAGMAAPLYQAFAAFREAFDACADAARPPLGADLRELVFAAGERRRAGPDRADPAGALRGRVRDRAAVGVAGRAAGRDDRAQRGRVRRRRPGRGVLPGRRDRR